jgi:four helix bundle protein
MNDKNKDLKDRTKQFSLRVIRLVEALPSNRTCNVIGHQLLRAGTSVGANYRAECRAKSPADFIFKVGIVEEEADESAFWIELLMDVGCVKPGKVEPLHDEACQLTAVMVASARTARATRSDYSSRKRIDLNNSALRTPHSAF